MGGICETITVAERCHCVCEECRGATSFPGPCLDKVVGLKLGCLGWRSGPGPGEETTRRGRQGAKGR